MPFLGDSAYLAELTQGDYRRSRTTIRSARDRTARPSLSDPDYGTRPEVRSHYEKSAEYERARAAFDASPFIDKFWPRALKEKTLPVSGLSADAQ